MYLDLLLDAQNLNANLADFLDVENFEIAVCYLGIPKTFNVNTSHIFLSTDIVVPQLRGERTLCNVVVHDSDKGANLVFEPIHVQYRELELNKFSTIQFSLKDQDDKPIVFDGGKVMIILHLRKKLTWKETTTHR